MIVFCPTCGTQNAGVAGARATCTACASTFDVPSEARAPTAPAPPAFSGPGVQVFSSPTLPTTPGAGRSANAYAIVSLVAGIVCCIPFVSPGLAIGCGIGALRQLDVNRDAQSGRGLAIAGIVLGAISSLLHLLWLIGILGRRF